MAIKLETERLIIRPPKIGDATPINDAIKHSISELQRWMPWASDTSLQTTEKFVKQGVEAWSQTTPHERPMVVELKSSKEIISVTGYNAMSKFDIPMLEIGFWVDSNHAGNGYVTESTIALTKFAFEYFSAIRVQICAQRENIKSIAVAERCGFLKEAVLKKYRRDCVTQEACDEVIYACFTKEQLPAMHVYQCYN